MSTTNATRVREYLRALESFHPWKSVAEFYAPDVVIQEFPNRIAPHGRQRLHADLQIPYEQGRQLLQSQTYDISHIVESGDDVALELEWTGTLAVPLMNLPSGSKMKAFIGMFFTFQDGRILSQRNYDCYRPFEL